MRRFATIAEVVGARGEDLGETDWVLVDQARIQLFADATGDHNWIHVDPALAAKSRYGGTIGLEWFFPKILETLNHAPQVYDATQVWLEAGDWFVWQLVGGSLTRSTCQAACFRSSG